jgi:UDP-galactopyranose mutase
VNILIVGAGFAGATAARELAEAGHQVLVIDKRKHIAGNAYDFINEHGIRVHKYGPHLWHTSNDDVQEWASRFTEWVPYRHEVLAQMTNGEYVPLPINHETIEAMFPNQLDTFADRNDLIVYDNDGAMVGFKRGAHAKFLESLVTHHENVTNSRQHVENSVGTKLCDLFFAPYTKKMWGLDLEDLPASVAARIPTNVESRSFDYFPKDKHQYLPKDGYTKMVENILAHTNIKVRTNTTRDDILDKNKFLYWQVAMDVIPVFDHIFTSEPIDTYFNCELGELPWRSIKLHTYSVPLPSVLPASVVNFTHDGPHTRATEWKNLPAHGENPHWTTITVEEPCDYRDNNMERYYPVKTAQEECPHRALYNRYREKAAGLNDVTFIGRCGMFVYQDMHAVISTTQSIVRKFIKENNAEV